MLRLAIKGDVDTASVCRKVCPTCLRFCDATRYPQFLSSTFGPDKLRPQTSRNVQQLPTCSCATSLKSCSIEGQTRFHAAPSTRDQSPGVPGRWPARSSTPGHEIPPQAGPNRLRNLAGRCSCASCLRLLICLLGLGSLALYDPHESLTDMSPTL